MLNNIDNGLRPSYWSSRREISTSFSKISIQSKGATLLLLLLHERRSLLKEPALWLNLDELPQDKYINEAQITPL